MTTLSAKHLELLAKKDFVALQQLLSTDSTLANAVHPNGDSLFKCLLLNSAPTDVFELITSSKHFDISYSTPGENFSNMHNAIIKNRPEVASLLLNRPESLKCGDKLTYEIVLNHLKVLDRLSKRNLENNPNRKHVDYSMIIENTKKLCDDLYRATKVYAEKHSDTALLNHLQILNPNTTAVPKENTAKEKSSQSMMAQLEQLEQQKNQSEIEQAKERTQTYSNAIKNLSEIVEPKKDLPKKSGFFAKLFSKDKSQKESNTFKPK